MATDYKTNQTKYTDYVVLSLYILFPPRRVLDYAYMDICNDETTMKNDRNYYIPDKQQFVFNVYKTAKTYKQQRFTMCNRLNDLLKDFIRTYNIQQSLLNMTEDYLGNRIKEIFFNTCGKRAGASIMRHSFLSYMDKTGFLDSMNKRYAVSRLMGHSVIEQLEYIKNAEKIKLK